MSLKPQWIFVRGKNKCPKSVIITTHSIATYKVMVGARGVACVIDSLPSKHKTLSSDPIIGKKKQKQA
jgi:hypothetical protein